MFFRVFGFEFLAGAPELFGGFGQLRVGFELETLLHAEDSASDGSYLFLLLFRQRQSDSLIVEVCQHLIGFNVVGNGYVELSSAQRSPSVIEAVNRFIVVGSFGSVTDGIDACLNFVEGYWLDFSG